MKRGLRPWPCARVALTVFATVLITGALLILGLSVPWSDFRGWLMFSAVPVCASLSMGVALLASRDSVLRWLRIEQDDATSAAFVSAAIAMLAFCEACRVLIELACSAVDALAEAIASSQEDPFASIAAGLTGLPTPRASYRIWGEVAVLLSCLVLMRLAQPIARLPRATRTSRAAA